MNIKNKGVLSKCGSFLDKSKKAKIILFLAVIAVFLAVRYLSFVASYISTDDAYVTGHIVTVSSRIDGHITRVRMEDNQWVNAGDLLVEIDPNDVQTKLNMQVAVLSAAQAGAKRAQKDMKRYEALLDGGGATQQQFDNALAEADLATARVGEVSAAVEQGKLSLLYTKIYAPQSGRLVHKAVEEGEYIRIGQPLVSIVPLEVWVVANFKETQVKRIKAGQSVEIRVDAYPQNVFNGHVDSIQAGTGVIFSLLPPENATGNFVKVVQRVPVKIVFDGDPNRTEMLSPGMSVVPEVKVR